MFSRRNINCTRRNAYSQISTCTHKHTRTCLQHTTGTGGRFVVVPRVRVCERSIKAALPPGVRSLFPAVPLSADQSPAKDVLGDPPQPPGPSRRRPPPPPIISSLQTHSCKRSGSNADPRRNLSGRIPFHCEELWFPSAH